MSSKIFKKAALGWLFYFLPNQANYPSHGYNFETFNFSIPVLHKVIIVSCRAWFTIQRSIPSLGRIGGFKN